MAIAERAPNTIFLASPQSSAPEIGDYHAGSEITPGHLVELYLDTTKKWRVNGSATELCAKFVAIDQPELNKGVDDVYAVGDLVRVKPLRLGDVAWMLVKSGETINACDLLQSAGDGTVKKATATTQDAGLGWLQALDTLGAVTVLTRCRAQRIS